jgi:hypothetical protein
MHRQGSEYNLLDFSLMNSTSIVIVGRFSILILTADYSGFFFYPEIELTASVPGRQGMLFPPRYLIPRLVSVFAQFSDLYFLITGVIRFIIFRFSGCVLL